MQCDAVRCSAMQCDAVRCSVMQCDAVRYKAMQCDAKRRCEAMQSGTERCRAVQSDAERYRAMQSDTERCRAVQSDAERYKVWKILLKRFSTRCEVPHLICELAPRKKRLADKAAGHLKTDTDARNHINSDKSSHQQERRKENIEAEEKEPRDIALLPIAPL
jgi:ribosomal protein L35